MRKPISLSGDERLRFMGALYSVFYRDEQIGKTEAKVLNMLEQTFAVDENKYKRYLNSSPDMIAAEINHINDVRVRVCFMAIIQEVHRKENDTVLKNPFSKDPDVFRTLVSKLSDKINLT